MTELREQLEAIWKDSKVRNPLRRVHWILIDRTGLPGVKRANRKTKLIYNRLTKEFSWRK